MEDCVDGKCGVVSLLSLQYLVSFFLYLIMIHVVFISLEVYLHFLPFFLRLYYLSRDYKMFLFSISFVRLVPYIFSFFFKDYTIFHPIIGCRFLYMS